MSLCTVYAFWKSIQWIKKYTINKKQHILWKTTYNFVLEFKKLSLRDFGGH